MVLARAERDKCIGCGFCLDSCPTYRERREEIWSPRGRIRALIFGKDGAMTLPQGLFTRCASCLACTPSCPVAIDFSTAFELQDSQGNKRRPPK